MNLEDALDTILYGARELCDEPDGTTLECLGGDEMTSIYCGNGYAYVRNVVHHGGDAEQMELWTRGDSPDVLQAVEVLRA